LFTSDEERDPASGALRCSCILSAGYWLPATAYSMRLARKTSRLPARSAAG